MKSASPEPATTFRDRVAACRNLELVAWRAAGALARDRKPLPREGALRVLAHVPAFLPVVRAGSEVSMATTLGMLAERGHEPRVIVDRDGITGTVEGLDVIAKPRWRTLVSAYRWADVVLTQLESRNRAIRLGTLTGTPVVHFLRMGTLGSRHMLGAPDLAVFNAEWLRAQSRWGGPSTVLHPPLVADRYETEPGDMVTMVNLAERKGGPIFYELARRRPDLEFLGVVGGWGQQQTPPDTPDNVTIVGPVSDIRDVYSRTRVLLMCWPNEPYGRCAVEAACSGIPTIAARGPGLREALGDAALYADHDDLAQWVARLAELDDPQEYVRHSEAARRRAQALATESEGGLRELESLIREIVSRC